MKLFFTLYCLLLTGILSSLYAQLASYNFNLDTNDQLNSYNPATVFGTPDFASGTYMALDSGEYIVLPDALNTAFDNNESLEIYVRFKVEGDWEATPAIDGFGEEARIILTTKEEYDTRVGGFDVAARQWEGALWLMVTYGDGIDYDFGWSKGKGDFVAQIDSDIWYDLNIKFVFDEELPYIQYIVNGTTSIAYYPNREEDEFAMDYEGFRQTITQQQIYLGSTIDNNIAERDGEHPSLDLYIDSLSFASPALPGNPTEVNNVLQSLIDHMNGNVAYTSEELEVLKSNFVVNWDENSYDANVSTVNTYMETYSNTEGFIFTLQYNGEDPAGFDPLKAIQFQMQQWVLDNKYSSSTVEEMAGLSFKEHERFPGAVSTSASRLTGATFTVDGDYQTDPGFYLNNQEYVRRPSGYFVPAGELVTITVPDAAVDQGLSVYIGAHRKNLQETFNEFRRFPRTSTTFPLDSKTVKVTNPFGGGIYIAIPDGNQLGPLTFQVDGAVKAPYYCTKEGFSNSLEDFMAEIQKAEVPYIDMESENFMTTITNGMAVQMTDPDSILSVWDKSFDAINMALGRPQKRFRSEYIIQDRQSHVKYTGAPAAYPMSLEVYAYPYEEIWQQPVDVEYGRGWYNRSVAETFNRVLFHEYGHLHNMPTLANEQETNVHLLATVAYSEAMGESIDSAFVYALVQRLNLEQATFDWILTPNFTNGKRIGFEPNNPWDQLLYQSRGLVKLVDIAKMFGWEALGNINAYFYDYQIANPNWSPYDLQDDQFIRVASEVMGFNMAPHFEFHGIIPSDPLVEELKPMPTSDIIKERIQHYRSLVPANNADFQPLFESLDGKIDPTFHQPRWDSIKVIYDEAYATRIVARIDTILAKYYDLTEADFNDEPRIVGTSRVITILENASLELELSDLIVEDRDNEYPNDFSLIILEGQNYSLEGSTITPSMDYVGFLSVPVQVNDGLETSDEFLIEIEVLQVNDIPIITGLVEPLIINKNESLTLGLENLIVEDDNSYPDGFTLILNEGDDYSLNQTTVTPISDFVGTLNVSIQVNDGIDDSPEYFAEVRVDDIVSLLQDANPISLFPNPTENGTIEISGKINGCKYVIYDMQGAMIQKGKVSDNKIEIIGDSGLYLVVLLAKNDRWIYRRIHKSQ